ncbi:hypothetical protein BDY19DRAFT_989975 [Irpex rosettiformis]|uniref:Uncharacterized protein n=1 Tax=Irpex rosettiformis TaxID=378272 RepID=A0ACB8UG62_9APHY|nr:hypothetical protein BDY19DRAFT_989975 [Irpex rosettiformis]
MAADELKETIAKGEEGSGLSQAGVKCNTMLHEKSLPLEPSTLTTTMSTLPELPLSPGVGARRKGPKSLPRLPASAFSPPNTGTSEQFPLAPSPSTLYPEKVIDAQVSESIDVWTADASKTLEDKAEGIVISLVGKIPEEVTAAVDSIRSKPPTPPVLAVLVPFSLEDGIPTNPPVYLSSLPPSPSTPSSPSAPRIVLAATYTRFSVPAVEALKWAVEQGHSVDLSIQTNLRAGEGAWEDLEELLSKAIPEKHQGKVILSNILPPPDDLTLPIVKLLTHPTYNDYQSQIATLSLYANVSVKFLPPAWPLGGEGNVDKKEWKRRIKMYVGPALEAFGYERIIFGSSPASSSHPRALSSSEWFELARECFAELGTEQEDLDVVFSGNARKVYAAVPSS